MMLSTLRTLPVLCMLLATQAFAAVESSSRSLGGIIFFTGQVVEPPCETAADFRQQQVEMRCQRNGVQTVETWPLSSLTGAGARSSLASLDVRYPGQQHKLAILTISYD